MKIMIATAGLTFGLLGGFALGAGVALNTAEANQPTVTKTVNTVYCPTEDSCKYDYSNHQGRVVRDTP